MNGRHTTIMRCSVTELAAIDNAIRGDRHYDLLLGTEPWTGRDRRFLERLRNIRGLNVIEEHGGNNGVRVTIAGSLTMDGFRRKL